MKNSFVQVTHTAPSNIACIKYWGKKDLKLNTPINSSVSVTMNQDQLKAITTITAGSDFTTDQLWLNGVEEDITKNKRVITVLSEIRKRAGDRVVNTPEGEKVVPASEISQWKVRIVSRNTFPTAAGLASSAAGYACLVHTLADVYNVKESYPGELSMIARQGSGSACRSLYGGFVEWTKGEREDALDSHAKQIADENHWPELNLLIAVISDLKKDTGSTDGMVRSVETSALLAHRASSVVPERLARIEKAYVERDFKTFAEITMADSNQFHATCMDTFPPIFYMNDHSKRVIGLVHRINQVKDRTIAGYTFDAGPNAVIFALKDDIPFVLAVLLANFPPTEAQLAAGPFVSDAAVFEEAKALIPTLPAELTKLPPSSGVIHHIYKTSVGDGPRVLQGNESLANSEGLPLNVTKDGDFASCL